MKETPSSHSKEFLSPHTLHGAVLHWMHTRVFLLRNHSAGT